MFTTLGHRLAIKNDALSLPTSRQTIKNFWGMVEIHCLTLRRENLMSTIQGLSFAVEIENDLPTFCGCCISLREHLAICN